LLNCELGFESEIIEQLKQIDSVKRVQGTFGTFDIFAQIETPTNEELNHTVSVEIRKLKNIRNSVTLVALE